MRLSLYTSVRNVLRMDFPLREMLLHHLPLADEIVINEGYSDDGTFELVSNLDPKIKVFRHHWDDTPSPAWWAKFSDDAMSHCTGDWCLKLDCDEFIPEWEFDRLRAQVAEAQQDILPVTFVNFYGNYKVYHAFPGKIRWITHKWILHRNRPGVHYVGDGSSAQIGDEPWPEVRSDALTLHHFGAVRSADQMRKKWREDGLRKQYRRSRWIPQFIYRLRPHDWFDADFIDYLRTYEGPFIQPVRDKPSRFIKDDLRLYRHLKQLGR
jgi:glycosyltransferase involved in cell wall biosynthesis